MLRCPLLCRVSSSSSASSSANSSNRLSAYSQVSSVITIPDAEPANPLALPPVVSRHACIRNFRQRLMGAHYHNASQVERAEYPFAFQTDQQEPARLCIHSASASATTADSQPPARCNMMERGRSAPETLSDPFAYERTISHRLLRLACSNLLSTIPTPTLGARHPSLDPVYILHHSCAQLHEAVQIHQRSVSFDLFGTLRASAAALIGAVEARRLEEDLD